MVGSTVADSVAALGWTPGSSWADGIVVTCAWILDLVVVSPISGGPHFGPCVDTLGSFL